MFVGEFLQGAEEEPGHDAEGNAEKGRAAGEADDGHEEARGAGQREGAERGVVELLEVLVAGAHSHPEEPAEGEESDDAQVHHEAADVAVGLDEVAVAGAEFEEGGDAVTAFAEAAAKGIVAHVIHPDLEGNPVAIKDVLEFQDVTEPLGGGARGRDGGELEGDDQGDGDEDEIDDVPPVPRDENQPDAQRDERRARAAEDHAVGHGKDAEEDEAALPFRRIRGREQGDGEDDDVGQRAAERGRGDEGREGAHLPRAGAAGVEAREVATGVVGIGGHQFFDFLGRLAHAVERDDDAQDDEEIEVAFHLRQVAGHVVAEAEGERGKTPAPQRGERHEQRGIEGEQEVNEADEVEGLEGVAHGPGRDERDLAAFLQKDRGERHEQHGVEEERDGGMRILVFDPAVKEADRDGQRDGAVDDRAGAEEAEEFLGQRRSRRRGRQRGAFEGAGCHPR